MRSWYLIPILLTGCTAPKWLLPTGNMIGKNQPHFGTVNNFYGAQAKQIQAATHWELYFWIAVIACALVFTPLGGILVSKLRKWKKTATHTIKQVGEYRQQITEDERRELDRALSKRQPPEVHQTVKDVLR